MLIQPGSTPNISSLKQFVKNNYDAVSNMSVNEFLKTTGLSPIASADPMFLDDLGVALANTVRPDMSPQEIREIALLDKALAMGSAQKKTLREARDTFLDSLFNKDKKNSDQRKRLIDSDVIFA